MEQPFTSAANFFPPILFARGDTPMGAAITKATDMVEERKREYRANGISYYRPWIFLITDGAPTDEWQAAANKVFQGKKIRSLPSLPSVFRGGYEDAGPNQRPSAFVSAGITIP